MSELRYLTNRHFMLATECPTKLFYTGKADYADQSVSDPFWEALAEGGFQVGALAQAIYPEGIAVAATELEEAAAETLALMERDTVTIFGATFLAENRVVRIDILKKDGTLLDLIDVRAKPIGHKSELIGKRSGKIVPPWKPDMLDVAFKDHVLRLAFPDAVVRPRMLLANKRARCLVDGLNQRIELVRGEGDGELVVRWVGEPAVESSAILIKVNVHDPIKLVRQDKYRIGSRAYDFDGYIEALAEAYAADTRIPPRIDCQTCGKCGFRATEAEESAGLLSGFKQCWREAMGFSDEDFGEPNVLELSSCMRKQAFLRAGKFFLRDLEEYDFDLAKPVEARQWMQVQKAVAEDCSPWIDVDGLRAALDAWNWPLHFVGFKACSIAVPFVKGQSPYDTVAFQFSHHVVHEDGRVEHADEYLNAEPGVFPNLEFVRRLKMALGQDEGTIVRYGGDGNRVLNRIIRQLEERGSSIPDGAELVAWLREITEDRETGWSGSRAMEDLCELVKKHYYQRRMGGSYSLQKVWSAVLNSSTYLQSTYGTPCYSGHNFKDQRWVRFNESGEVIDPYASLPSAFPDTPQTDAAAIYARLQFSSVSEPERATASAALRCAAELDTLAMVMIWEAWKAALN